MEPPFWPTGTIRKSTTRIESTREMSLSRYGVEWSAETGEGRKTFIERVAITYLTLAVPFWKRIVRRVDLAASDVVTLHRSRGRPG